MKKTDVAMIIVIASLSVMISYFVGSTLLGGGKTASVKVKTAEVISTKVVSPGADIFNGHAINPTVEVIIGNSQARATQ